MPSPSRPALRAWSSRGAGGESEIELLAGCGRGLEHRGIIVCIVAHAAALGFDAVALAQHIEESRESVAIAIACMRPECIGRAIAAGEMRKLLLDERKVALARLVLQA